MSARSDPESSAAISMPHGFTAETLGTLIDHLQLCIDSVSALQDSYLEWEKHTSNDNEQATNRNNDDAETLDSVHTLLDFPPKVLERIMQFLDPIDVCRIASVCKGLRAVADSDVYWSQKVPIYYNDSVPSSMKQIYFRLRNNLQKNYWILPTIANGCFLMPSSQLNIVWGGNSQYWQFSTAFEGSWFREVAYLHAVCWFDVRGKIEMIFRPRRYLVSLRISFQPNVRGFEELPVTFSLSTSHGQNVERQEYLTRSQLGAVGHDWIKLDLGEFIVEREMPLNVEFIMQEHGGHWKSGLIIDCMVIQPF